MGEARGKKLKGALRWRMTKAETAAFLREAAEADPSDRALAAKAAAAEAGREDPDPAFALYWRAFFDLTHDRPRDGMGGVSFIPFTAIDRWAARHEIDGGEFEHLRQLLHEMDAEYLTVMTERAKTKST